MFARVFDILPRYITPLSISVNDETSTVGCRSSAQSCGKNRNATVQKDTQDSDRVPLVVFRDPSKGN